jgi:dihydrofolate synthase/folylpolyglutamate synthase
LGSFQRDNLAVALTAAGILNQQGWGISPENVIQVLADIRIPGRMEVLSHQPPVLCDVAHNPHGARALAASLEECFPGQKKVLVLGIVDDKDKMAMIQALGPQTRSCIVTKPAGSRNANWRDTARIMGDLFPDIELSTRENVEEAAAAGMAALQAEEYLLLTGSFYLMDSGRKALNRLG